MFSIFMCMYFNQASDEIKFTLKGLPLIIQFNLESYRLHTL